MASVNYNAQARIATVLGLSAGVCEKQDYTCVAPISCIPTAALPGAVFKVRGYYAATHEVFLTRGTPITPAPTGHATTEVGHLKIG